MTVNAETTVRKLISVSRNLATEIDDFRFKRRIKAESEAIRTLIQIGLETVKSQDNKDG